MAIDKKGTKQIADNRKARHDYFVLEQIECGIELVGTEVKSIRNGGVNLKDSWCSIEERCGSKVCTYPLMNTAIFSTVIHAGRESCCSTNVRY